jgi:hypothetical protein
MVATHRSLLDDLPSDIPSPAPSIDSNDGVAPTPADSTSKSDASSVFGWFVFFVIFIPVGSFIIWRLWIRYQHRHEQRMLDYRSAQADRVLGDMQMVPNEDLDNDLI